MYAEEGDDRIRAGDEPGAGGGARASRSRRRSCSASIRGCCSRSPKRRRERSARRGDARPMQRLDAESQVARIGEFTRHSARPSCSSPMVPFRDRPTGIRLREVFHKVRYTAAPSRRGIVIRLPWLTRTTMNRRSRASARRCSTRAEQAGPAAGRRLHADRRDPPARRHRLRDRRLARHVALVSGRRAAARHRRRDVRAGQDRLAQMKARRLDGRRRASCCGSRRSRWPARQTGAPMCCSGWLSAARARRRVVGAGRADLPARSASG